MSKQNLFQERDISWLSFNYRVLQEAKDPTVPLYERIKFLAIYSSNLDEFFRVRVASLRSFRKLRRETRREMDLRPKRLLKKIRHLVQIQQAEFGQVFREEILPALSRHHIFLVNEGQLGANQRKFAKQFFKEKIQPLLQPVVLDKDEPPFLENKDLYFIIGFEDAAQLPMLVKLPTAELGRFILLPSEREGHYVAFLDDMVRVGLPALFPKKKIKGAWSVKVSRDAELYIDDEYSGDLLEKIKQGLDERHVGLPTRFLFDAAMPASLQEQVRNALKLSKNDVIPGARYHNFNDFFAFPNPAGLQELHDEPMPPLPHPSLEDALSLLVAMQERDYLLHFPYQKFDYVTRLIEEAAADEQVESLKITLYRVAVKSAVCEALLKALKAGKKVSVFIEAKARFDEESNLLWGEKLEKAGATVRYSFPGIKVHSKLLLINRREKAATKSPLPSQFAYFGTGNFNEKTALLYADHALLTCDKRLAEEAAQVFDLLEGKLLLPKCKHLLVSPFTLREKFEDLIDREIENAIEGKDAWMILKMNSLEDKAIAEKLIEASKAGVKIKMIVRGICILTPGIEGETDNIEIISILDRFLEHARVYVFASGGKEKMYLASADWMHRNLDRRVEVAFPIYDENLRQEIRQIIDFQLADNCKARILDQKNRNKYKKRRKGEAGIRAQTAAYEFLKS